MNLLEILKQYGELEEAMADVYRRFSERFAADEPAARLFARLSREEQAHRDLVRFQLRLVQKDSSLLDGIDLEQPPLDALLDKIRSAARPTGGCTLRDAIIFALVMENDSGESHLWECKAPPDHPLAKLLLGLRQADQAHGRALLELAESQGIHPTFEIEGTITPDNR